MKTIRHVLIITALLGVLSIMPAQNQATDMPQLHSSVFDWEKLPVINNAFGQRRDIANHSTAGLAKFQCHIRTLNPGLSTHLPHRHLHEELIIVKDGLVEVSINGADFNAGPGSVIFFASNDPHGVINVGEKPATYWVMNFVSRIAHDPSRHNSSPTLRSGIHKWEKIAVPGKNGYQQTILAGSSFTIDKLSVEAFKVAPGQVPSSPSRHPEEKFVIVHEGTLEVTVDEKTNTVGAGSLLFFPSNDLHSIRNPGPSPLLYQVIRLTTIETPVE